MSVPVTDVLAELRRLAPPELAQSWDNVGLLVDAGRPVTAVLTALDITPPVVEEAAALGCELIVAHHPVIFQPLKTLGSADVPALLLRRGISAVCMHTNLDAAEGGGQRYARRAARAAGYGRLCRRLRPHRHGGTHYGRGARAPVRRKARRPCAVCRSRPPRRPRGRSQRRGRQLLAGGAGARGRLPCHRRSQPSRRLRRQALRGWAWSLPGTGVPSTPIARRSGGKTRRGFPRPARAGGRRRYRPVFVFVRRDPPWHWMPPRWRLSPGN